MFGHMKSPLHRFSKHKSAGPEFPSHRHANPFSSDDDFDNKKTLKASGRASLEPSLITLSLGINSFDDDEIKGNSSSRGFLALSEKTKCKTDFRDSGGLESQTVEELESYAVYKAEETTKTVNSCLKIAEDMREDANKTLVTLHQQREQITRTHVVAADMDHDLSRGEKLLGNLGGIFSKTWKPKKSRHVTGPIITRDDPVQRKGNHLELRERLGLNTASKEKSHTRKPLPKLANDLLKVEDHFDKSHIVELFHNSRGCQPHVLVETVKQDDALIDLSNVLGELKDMAIDMGSEIERQNKALGHIDDDVEELNFRVKGANQRARCLLGR
ncbi:Helical region found in SNAREs [Orobanche hederae]